MRVNGIIIGAGIIGSAIAYELSNRGVTDLHVIDPDLEGPLSSTERNAGGVRHLWQQPINRELARVSISFFESIKTEIGFNQAGYLWLFARGEEVAGEDMLTRTRSHQLSYEKLSIQDIKNRYPFIDKTEDLAFAIFGAKDGLINSNSLKQYFRSEAKKRGVTFHDRHVVQAMKDSAQGAEVTLSTVTSDVAAQDHLKNPGQLFKTPPQMTWKADFVILAAGAWSRELLEPHLPHPLIEPIRRQIILFKAENFDLNQYGMIVDSSRVYFHPEGGNILAGLVLKTEKAGFKFDVDSDFFESHIWPALYERSSQLERLKPITGWGGLYSYTPDTSGILGKIPAARSLYECHSFTGRGVMQSYGAAVAISDLVMKNRFETIEASSLSRERFQPGKESHLLPEGLHI
jgi:FAD-dependent oxidoreductase domain-containing protein 1